ncbi:head maturation protease, ClpP-related [Celeribacter marinus]|uniref:ATP-dependent Clp protease proteolytic subunit n=1 Tax=Celeribacter marinus TaxID=1397108 RepID=A0A0P0A5S9_9RHOB|nr:head maturation protease, ClpP-related [Celeribacter marinus]ALI55977.1 prophage Clp protease-like protein [Celeribacter marinus]SFK96564.1 ATP-dependent protease ClpP, protease subunit [Celeribacter marinus]
MNTWYTIRARASGAEVLIYDEIGAYGVSAKGFLAELGALPDDAPIDLRLNSPGGSVFDAVAIYNALTRHEGTITVWIDGIAASAASYIAMAGDEIIMPENAFLMIHDPSGIVMGTAADMRDMAGTLDKIAASMTRGYAAKSGKPEEDIAALLTAETWFDAKDALEAGLATRMAEPVRIAASFDIGRFRNAPPDLVEMVKADIVGDDTDVAGSDVSAPVLDPKTKGPAGNVDHAAAAEEPAPASEQGADAADQNTQSLASEDCPAKASARPDVSAIRAEAIAHAGAVIDLCRLAGQPQMAGRFLEEDASLDAVRAQLLAAKAEAVPQITSHHPQPGPNPTARPWGDVIARTFKLKG